MQVAVYYAVAGTGCLLLAVIMPHWLLQLLTGWSGLSLLVVSSAYGFNMAGIFRKRRDGTIPFYIRWLFIPFLSGVHLYNRYVRSRDKVPPIQQIEPGIFLAGRLSVDDVETLKQLGVVAVLDVTAEFDALDWSLVAEGIDYLNIPVLDHATPSSQQLARAVGWLQQQHRQKRAVLVHCALGRGRSVMVLAAFLLYCHPELKVTDVLQQIGKVRTTARLNRRQYKALEHWARQQEDKPQTAAWLIVNPVSGGGKWQQYQQEIFALLSPYYALTILLTDDKHNGTQQAELALADGASVIIACGGDGTVTEVAAALTGRNCKLGIIPLGTTNALAHVLWGWQSKAMPVESACCNIIEGYSSAVDTARCNEQLMLLLAGIGFEQQMIEQADRGRKDELGQLAYLHGLWQAINQNQRLTLWVSFDGEPEQELQTSSLVVANAAPFTTVLAQGEGEPDMADGLLDVTWLLPSEEPGKHMLSLAELLLAGLTRTSLKLTCQHNRVREISVRSADGPCKYAIDGEIFSADTLYIRIEPASLQVFRPAPD